MSDAKKHSLKESMRRLRHSMAFLAHTHAATLVRSAAAEMRLAQIETERREMQRRHDAEKRALEERRALERPMAAEIRAAISRFQEMDERFDELFRRIEATLLEHSRLRKALPDKICEKIGFRAPEQPS
jgi:hypothetical protein